MFIGIKRGRQRRRLRYPCRHRCADLDQLSILDERFVRQLDVHQLVEAQPHQRKIAVGRRIISHCLADLDPLGAVVRQNGRLQQERPQIIESCDDAGGQLDRMGLEGDGGFKVCYVDDVQMRFFSDRLVECALEQLVSIFKGCRQTGAFRDRFSPEEKNPKTFDPWQGCKTNTGWKNPDRFGRSGHIQFLSRDQVAVCLQSGFIRQTSHIAQRRHLYEIISASIGIDRDDAVGTAIGDLDKVLNRMGQRIIAGN